MAAHEGRHVAFLGMDGIGKSSMARLLQTELASRGMSVRSVSWRDQMRTETRPNIATALRELWVESWRLIFLDDSAGSSIPPDFEQFDREAWEDKLVGLDLGANPPAGPLAAAWLDLSGQTLVHYEVVRPLCGAGTWVIEESFGLKLVLKELLTARALGGDPQLQAEVTSTLSRLGALFEHRAPDIGIVVSGPVAMAYEWRMSEQGKTNSMEDMGAAGQKGWEGFAALQSECDLFYRELAATSSWLVFEMENAPAEQNFARLLQQLREHPRWLN